MTPQRIYFNRNDVDLFKRSYLRSKQEILKQLVFKDVADLTFFSEEIMNIVEGKSYKMSNYKHSGVIIFNCATGSHVCCTAYVKYKKEDGYFVYCSHLGQHSPNCSGNGGGLDDENFHSTFIAEKDKPTSKKQRTVRLPKEQLKKLPKIVVANKTSTSLKSLNSSRPRRQRVVPTKPVPSSSAKERIDPKVNPLVYCGLFYHTWKKGKASNLPIKSDLYPSNAANAIQNHQYHATDYSDSDDQSLISVCSLSSGKYPRTPGEVPQCTIVNVHDSRLPISSSFHLTHFLLRKMQCVAATTAIQQVVTVCDWTMHPVLANRCLQCQFKVREKLLSILEIEKSEAEQLRKQLNEDNVRYLETQTLFTSESSPCSSSSSSSALAINLVQSTRVSSKDTTISSDSIEKSHYFHFLLQLIDVLLFPFRAAPLKDDTSVDSASSDDSMETLLQSNREQLIDFMEELIRII